MPSSLKPAEQCFRTSRLKRNRGNPTSSLRLASSFKRCKGDGAASIRSRFREELLEEILVQSISRCRGSAVTSVGFGFRFGFLPEELLEEILLRLPVKSIVRFRSVCKRWRSLFTSRLFIDLYRSRIRCDPYSVAAVHSSTKKFLLDMAPELKDIGWSDQLLPNWGRVAWTFGPLNNGIYGVTFHLVEISTGRSPILTAKIGFCNPATRDYRIIDPFPCQFHSLLSEAALKRPQLNFGFGSVPKENSSELDYKVVVLISYGEPFSSFLSFVYSLQSGEWKKLVDYERGKRQIGDVKAALDLHVPLVVSPQMFALKGRWHWLGRSQGNVQSFNVLSFNFADEEFKLLGGPTIYFDDYDVGTGMDGELLVLQDHLAVMHFMFPQCLEVSVWMMMEYGVEESWTRIYKIQPNYYDRISRFVGIYPRPVRDEEKSGVIHIERLTFEDKDNNQTVVCDKNGYEIFSGCKSLSHIDWNVAGISTYMETLEPLS